MLMLRWATLKNRQSVTRQLTMVSEYTDLNCGFKLKGRSPVVSVNRVKPDPASDLALEWPTSMLTAVRKTAVRASVRARVVGLSTNATRSVDRAAIRVEFDDKELFDGGWLLGISGPGSHVLPAIASA